MFKNFWTRTFMVFVIKFSACDDTMTGVRWIRFVCLWNFVVAGRRWFPLSCNGRKYKSALLHCFFCFFFLWYVYFLLSTKVATLFKIHFWSNGEKNKKEKAAKPFKHTKTINRLKCNWPEIFEMNKPIEKETNSDITGQQHHWSVFAWLQ